jgi:hypothetical protein
MSVVPADNDVTRPDTTPIEAILGDALTHVPPLTEPDRYVELPTQSGVPPPDMIPGTVSGCTVTMTLAKHEVPIT